MKLPRAIVVLSALVVGFGPPASAQAFRGLGFLDLSDPSPYSQAHGVSGDGTTAVGESDGQAFRWRVVAPGVLEPLGFLPGGSVSFGKGVSADGSVVVGYGDTPDGNRAFRWTSMTGPVSLGTVTGNEQNFGEDCSADGSVVVGRAFGSANERGFRWTQATGMVQYETLPVPGKPADALAVSGDGMVGVGRSGCCDQNNSAVEAVRWPNGGLVAEGLGDLQVTPFPWSASAGVSADGLVVVGGGTSGGAALFSAFRWSGGAMTELTPPLPTGDESCALDASADGTVIVGAFSAGFGDSVPTPVNAVPQARAFFWSEALAMTDLQQFLVARGLGPFLQGWNLKAATGISDDGNIIVGYGRHDGLTEAFIVALDGTPFESDNGGVPPPPPDPPGGYWGSWTFGVSEHHGFLWHPSKGPVPILPDPPPELLAAAGEGGARWVEGALAPRSGQHWAVLSSARSGEADFRVLRFDGRAWSLGFTSQGPAGLAASRGFDIVHEDHSGDAIVVYENGLGTPRYRTFAGGLWSEERSVPSGGEGSARWIELAARRGSDEVSLVSLDERGTLLALTWDGSRWLGASPTVLAEDVGAFDVDYEAASGALLVAWSLRGKDGIGYARRSRNGWQKARKQTIPGLPVEFVDLAAEPSSDRIAGLFVGGDAQALSMWNGSAWDAIQRRELPPRAAGATLAGLPGAVGWAATTRTALAVSGGGAPGTLSWSRWTSDGGWSAQRAMIVPGKGLTRSVRMLGSSDGGPFLLASDSRSSLFAFHYGDGTWQAVADPRGRQEVASPDTAPFGLALSTQVVLVAGEAACSETRIRAERPVELLSFALVPAGHATRVDMLAFSLDDAVGIERGDWTNLELVVDANANGTLDAAETTTAGGRGYADPTGKLLFFLPFEVAEPTHYVLRATLPPLDKGARVDVSLEPAGIVTPRGPTAGGARRALSLRGRGARTCG